MRKNREEADGKVSERGQLGFLGPRGSRKLRTILHECFSRLMHATEVKSQTLQDDTFAILVHKSSTINALHLII